MRRAPTAQARAAFAEFSSQAQAQVDALDGLISANVPALNEAIRAAGLPTIVPV